MMIQVLQYLPVLAVAMIVNILLGIYNNISIEKQEFDWKKLLQGGIKAVIVALTFLGLSYCFDATGAGIDLGTFELTPSLIMISAISIYVTKGVITLASILGVRKNVSVSTTETTSSSLTTNTSTTVVQDNASQTTNTTENTTTDSETVAKTE